jgi:omega-6 fatty acid desaturase (delta-12 desaturase)
MSIKIKTSAASDAYEGWRKLVAQYQQPDLRASVWQINNSFGGFFLSLVLMVLSLQVSYWLTLLLALPTAGFLVRIFIIQHDCGHGSFFKSRSANDIVGTFCSFFTLLPYKFWRKSHAVHHAHHAQLDERGIGDVWTMTVDEYIEARWWKRVAYRVFRHPFFLFGIAPTISFVLVARLPIGGEKSWHNGEHASVWWNNLAIASWFVVAGLFLGFSTVAMIYLPVIVVAGGVGTWLFYVQHQFEQTYWEHSPGWDYTLAALQGSSYYELPPIIQWFTGNIGFHHIHHLSPRIPNYKLQKCHEENATFQKVARLTLASSLQTTWLALWDEERSQLVTFREEWQLKGGLIAAK